MEQESERMTDHDALSRKGVRVSSNMGGKAQIPLNMLFTGRYPARYEIFMAIRCPTRLPLIRISTDDMNPVHYWNGYRRVSE